MDAPIVGIDVSKDRLDVHVLPDGESFAVDRTGAGIDRLIEKLAGWKTATIALEATGGFERSSRQGWPAPACPSSW